MSGGFQYVGTDQQEPNGKIKTFNVDAAHATILAKGDVVRITGTSTLITGIAEVDAAAAAQSVTGVISGVNINFTTENLTETGLPATTAGSVLVQVDPLALYEVDVVNGPLDVGDVGLNCDLVATAATRSGGMTVSNMTLNATGKNTTNTLQFRVVKLLTGSDGVFGSRARVRINNTTTITGTTGV